MIEEGKDLESSAIDEATRILFEATPKGQKETRDDAKKAYKQILKTLGKPPQGPGGMNHFVNEDGRVVLARFTWGRTISATEMGVAGEMGFADDLLVETMQPGMVGKRRDPLYVTVTGALASDPTKLGMRQIVLTPDGTYRTGDYTYQKGIAHIASSKLVEMTLPGNFWPKVAEAVKRSTKGPAFPKS